MAGMLEDIQARLERIEGYVARLAKCGPLPTEEDGGGGMIDQQHSDLGRRNHCAAVRRRIREGAPGAVIIRKRHLLSGEAYAEELQRACRVPAPRAAAEDAPPEDAYHRALSRARTVAKRK